jgi:hypothetical protein
MFVLKFTFFKLLDVPIGKGSRLSPFIVARRHLQLEGCGKHKVMFEIKDKDNYNEDF